MPDISAWTAADYLGFAAQKIEALNLVAQGHVFTTRVNPLLADDMPVLHCWLGDVALRNTAPNRPLMFRVTADLHVDACMAFGSAALANTNPVQAAYGLIQGVLKGLLTDEEFLGAIEGVGDVVITNRVVDEEHRFAVASLVLPILFSEVFTPAPEEGASAISVRFDFVDPPADANRQADHPEMTYAGGYPGPDGRFELEIRTED